MLPFAFSIATRLFKQDLKLLHTVSEWKKPLLGLVNLYPAPSLSSKAIRNVREKLSPVGNGDSPTGLNLVGLDLKTIVEALDKPAFVKLASHFVRPYSTSQ